MKKLVLVVLPLVLLIALGGGATAWMMGVLPIDELFAADAAPAGADLEEEIDPGEIVFITLPEILVNLNLSGPRMRFLKFTAAIEVAGEDQAEVVRRFVPRITDNMHLYLRSLQPEELSGAEGVYRIKKDLLARINQVVRPAEVREVLVRDMLVQ